MPKLLPKASGRSEKVSVRLRPHELRMIDAAAQRAGQTRAEWIRDTMLRQATELALANAGES